MAIEKLASSLHFPLKKLLVVEGSKRSAHSNAYFYGFWKNKYIVLFDTLLKEGVMNATDKPSSEEEKKGEEKDEEAEKKTVKDEAAEGQDEEAVAAQEEVVAEGGSGDEGKKKKKSKGCSTPEILGVLAHELGHWKLSHNIKIMVVTQVRLSSRAFNFTKACSICLRDNFIFQFACLLLSETYNILDLSGEFFHSMLKMHIYMLQFYQKIFSSGQSVTLAIQRILVYYPLERERQSCVLLAYLGFLHVLLCIPSPK